MATGERYDPITREQKEEWDREIEEAARLQGTEPQAGDYASGHPDGRDDEENSLDIFSDQRDRQRQHQIENAFDLGQQQHDMNQAATAGDRQSRDARIIQEAGERDARVIAEEAARNAARQQQENSWSHVLGDAVENGLTAGGQALGAGFGKEAGKKVADSIFDSEKPRHDGKPKPAAGKSPGKKTVATTGENSAETAAKTQKTAAMKETHPAESRDESADKKPRESAKPEVAQPAPNTAQPSPSAAILCRSRASMSE